MSCEGIIYMKGEEYALLMLDNMPLKGHFVVAKAIGCMEVDDYEERQSYTIYKDLVKGEIIYPSSYEVNEFIDSDEYVKQLKSLKWISRKKISKEEALEFLKDLNRANLLAYDINIISSKEKKNNRYDEDLRRHKKIVKKIEHKR